MNLSNGNSFADGNSMCLGGGASYGANSYGARDGSRPASASWLFAVLVFRA